MKVIINNDTEKVINVSRYERRYDVSYNSTTGALFSINFQLNRPDTLENFMQFTDYINENITKIEVLNNADDRVFLLECTECKLDNLSYGEGDVRDFDGTAVFSIYQE